MCSIPIRGRRPLSQRLQRSSRVCVYAADCGLSPPAQYSSTYASNNRSHLLIAVLPNVSASELTIARRNVTEINNMNLQYDFLGGRDEPGTELKIRLPPGVCNVTSPCDEKALASTPPFV